MDLDVPLLFPSRIQLSNKRSKTKDSFINIAHSFNKHSVDIKSNASCPFELYLILACIVDNTVNGICHHKCIII